MCFELGDSKKIYQSDIYLVGKWPVRTRKLRNENRKIPWQSHLCRRYLEWFRIMPEHSSRPLQHGTLSSDHSLDGTPVNIKQKQFISSFLHKIKWCRFCSARWKMWHLRTQTLPSKAKENIFNGYETILVERHQRLIPGMYKKSENLTRNEDSISMESTS